MYWNNRIRTAKLGYILLSFAMCILGVIAAAVPNISVIWFCRVGGILMLLFGCVKIIGYYANDLYCLAFQHDLAFGVLLIALGTVLILRTDPMIVILCTILGIFILADALLKVQIAIDSKKFGLGKWWMILLSAIVTGIIGFLLIYRPSESAAVLTVLLGLALIAEGVMNLTMILIAVKLSRGRFPLIIDSDT